MKRLYDNIIKHHIDKFNEMLFISGPRQVGKTTCSKSLEQLNNDFLYLNWDNEEHKSLLMLGPSHTITHPSLKQNTLKEKDQKPIIVFDEIHKRPDWKNYLKGFFDTYGDSCHIVVTGSARLDLYKKGGDSLMGRYFLNRMHPLSVAECINTNIRNTEITAPQVIADEKFNKLYEFGGFPKPFLQHNSQFSSRWQSLRTQQLVREDIRDSNVIHELGTLQNLTEILKQNSASQLTYNSIAKLLRVSVDTVKRWIDVLESFFYCYRIKPWSKNIVRSLIKEPKVFLWDWAQVNDIKGQKQKTLSPHTY